MEFVRGAAFSRWFAGDVELNFLPPKQVRSRRNEDDIEQNPGEIGLFTGTEGTAPPLDAGISEK